MLYLVINKLTLILVVSLFILKVAAILCHCDFCTTSVPVNTCRTDGYCLSLTWLQPETHVVHHAYRCLDRRMYFPRQKPTQCAIAANRNVSVVTACCKTNMCNQNLTPTLPPQFRATPAPIDEMSFATLMRRRHHSQKTTTPQPTT